MRDHINVKRVNGAFQTLLVAMNKFRAVAKKCGFPVETLSFRVQENGDTHTHVGYLK